MHSMFMSCSISAPFGNTRVCLKITPTAPPTSIPKSRQVFANDGLILHLKQNVYPSPALAGVILDSALFQNDVTPNGM